MSPPPPQWRPTARWQVRRVLRALVPLLIVGWCFLVFTGRAHDLLGDPKRFLVFFVGFFVLVVGLIVGSAVSGRRGRRELRSTAEQEGWQVYPSDPRWTARWTRAPFGAGHSRSATDVLAGVRGGTHFAAFTYRYTTGSGEDATRHVLGVVTVALPGSLPWLEVLPEGLVGSIAPGLARTDIDLESDAFNRRYRVRAEDRKYAVDVLTPRTVEALLAVEPFAFRIDGADVVAYWQGAPSRQALIDRLDTLTAVVANIPRFVWTDRGRPLA